MPRSAWNPLREPQPLRAPRAAGSGAGEGHPRARRLDRWRRRLALAPLAALASVSIGCGAPIVVPTWLHMDPSSQLTLELQGIPLSPVPLEGGLYAVISLDLSNPLLITGTIDVPQIRIAAQSPLFQVLCISKDVTSTSQGTIRYDVLTGDMSVDFPIATRTWSPLSGATTTESSPEGVAIPLDPALISALLDQGTVDGVLTIPMQLTQDTQFGSLAAKAIIDALLTSASVPPTVTASSAALCQAEWDAQGAPLEVLVNSKATYLNWFLDDPKPPRVLKLSDYGAQPGDVLRLTRKGTFLPTAAGPTAKRIGAVFSSSDSIKSNGSLWNPRRIPGAIDAGSNFTSPRTAWFAVNTNISEDFAVDNSVDVVVPPGANYLFLAAMDSYYSDNFSTDLRVSIEVNP